MARNGKINANYPHFNFPMTSDPELYRHKEWLGLLQPVGLVVSPIALVKAQVILNRSRAVELQQRLESLVIVKKEMTWMADFPAFAQQVLEWLPEDLSQPPPELEVSLPDYGETLRPDYAVKDPDSQEWILLIQILKSNLDLDSLEEGEKKTGWKATPQAKFERLLRETQIPAGILSNGREIRLVYAPRGESSGFLSFLVKFCGK
jgi:hypothetical protein